MSDKPSQLYEVDKLESDSKKVDNQLVIPIIEESVKVGKEIVETGRVKIVKTVHEREELVTMPLNEEEITVERKPFEKLVETHPAVRQEGEITIYSVVKEVVVVEKKLMLVEEIHVTKRERTTISSDTVSLRSESISIERESPSSERPG